MDRYSLGSVARLYLDIVAAGAGVISLGPSATIKRLSDGKWLNAASDAWEVNPVNNAMSETDSVNFPGRYEFDFDQSLDTLSGHTGYIAKLWNSIGTLALEYRTLTFGPLAGVVSPELCSVQGTIFNSSGDPRNGAIITATLQPVFQDDQGRAIEADRVVATYTNALGDFDLPLARGGIFRLEIEAVGYNRKVVIPDSPFVLFTDL